MISVSQVMLTVAGLLAVATIFSVGARRLALPFSAVLVLVGIALAEVGRAWPGVLPFRPIALSPELLMYIFLPTMLFKAGLGIDTRLLLKNIIPSLALAIPALIVSSLLTGVGVHLAIGLPIGVALLFGALISATDSTAALDVFEETAAPKRLEVLAQGENLFNDATAVVLFSLMLGMIGVAGGLPVSNGNTVANVLGSFLFSFLGGLGVGGLIGLFCGKIVESVDDDLIEILFTTAAGYLSFIVGEALVPTGGIMAVVGAALTLSGWGRTKFSVGTVEHLQRFWTYLAFAANALVFLLVGLMIDLRGMAESLPYIAAAIGLAVVGRALGIYTVFPLVNRLPWVERADFAHQTAMTWGGLRGAMALVLAMAIPEAVPFRELVLHMTVGVVLFSLIVQGITLRPAVRLLGLHRATLPERFLLEESLLTAKRHARARISEMNTAGVFSNRVVEKLDWTYAREEDLIQWELDELRSQGGLKGWEEFRLLKREQLLIEKRVYQDLYSRGQLSEPVYKELQHSIELQIDRLRAEGQLPAWTIRSPFSWRVESLVFRVADALIPHSDWVNRYRLRRIAERYETHWGRVIATQRVLREVPRLAEQYPNSPGLVEELRLLYSRWHDNARARLDMVAQHFPEYVSQVQELMALRLCLQAEEETINELERLEVLPEREARAVRAQLRDQLRRLKERPLEALEPKPDELLARVPFFQDVPKDEFMQVVPLLRQRTYLADEIIVREGDVGSSMFLICRGVVRVTLGREGLPEIPVATLIAGDFFGEMAVLTSNPRTATVKAVTDVIAYVLDSRDLHRVARHCPGLNEQLEGAYQRRRRGLDSHLSRLGRDEEEQPGAPAAEHLAPYPAGGASRPTEHDIDVEIDAPPGRAAGPDDGIIH